MKIRNKLKEKRNSFINKIEHNLLCKHVKYKIRADLKNYNDKIIKKFIDPHLSIKKIKK